MARANPKRQASGGSVTVAAKARYGRARSKQTAPIQVVWFKRDLRVVDHRPLAQAASRGPVLPLYIVEPELWAQPDASERHWAFISESLAELHADLARLGQPLVIKFGSAVQVLDEAYQMFREIGGVWSHEETGNAWSFSRDLAVSAWTREHGIPWNEIPQHGVIRKLSQRNGWAARWDRQMAEPLTSPPVALEPLTDPEWASSGHLHLPTAADLRIADRTPCPGRQPGDRTAGLDCLDSFLHTRGRTYRRAMSSPIEGATACSRLSPHLAFGTLSMRETAQATWIRRAHIKAAGTANGADRGFTGSLQSFTGRLHWHCHFMQKLESQPEIEFEDMHAAYKGLRGGATAENETNAARLAAYQAGETGFPFVDACLRSLAATGWINFRMRAMLMAFASYHLWLPWRDTGLHLARLFTDYEPGIHWPQTQMQSGTTGINTPRIYNPVKQGHDQDPTGAFVRTWVPELHDVPDAFAQEPWNWDGAEGVIGRTYAPRIVDHVAAAKAARETIWGVRRGQAYRTAANEIQDRHGSRKSGIPNRGQRGRAASTSQTGPTKPGRRGRAKAGADDQLDLEL